MDKRNVIEFFDQKAPIWDAMSPKSSDEVINTILDNAGVAEGVSVLDIGCGTGVLIPFYLERGVSSVTAVDFSEKMIEAAKQNFTDPRVKLICADAEVAAFDGPFDCCIIYHAFPHFTDPNAMIANLSKYIKKGGSITIAHGFSRARIDQQHHAVAEGVSEELWSDDKLTELLAPYFDVTVIISDDKMQDMIGIKK
ncbi:MAG: class I SAM-dependent methyltransferase [Clostridia bacterium]|nr:class I SAM-dependent methyltransferase [Clostridia bacterium]